MRRFGIERREGVGHDAVVDQIVAFVEQVRIVRETLVERIERSHRGGIRHDEADVLPLEAVVFLRVATQQFFAQRFVFRRGGRVDEELRERIERGDRSVVESVERPELFGVFGTFDGIVFRKIAQRVDDDPFARRDDQRNGAALAQQIEERGRRRGQLDAERIVAPTAGDGRIDDFTLQRGDHFEQDRVVVQTRERARNPGFLIPAAGGQQCGQRKNQKDFFHSCRIGFFWVACTPPGIVPRPEGASSNKNIIIFRIIKTRREPFVVCENGPVSSDTGPFRKSPVAGRRPEGPGRARAPRSEPLRGGAPLRPAQRRKGTQAVTSRFVSAYFFSTSISKSLSTFM